MTVQRGDVVLEAHDLVRSFRARASHGLFAKKRTVAAVDGVNIQLRAGEVLAIVGESGSGKSVLSRLLARIVAPSSGSLSLHGQAVDLAQRRDLAYASQVQLVLQDPFASINPIHKTAHSINRALLLHGTAPNEVDQRAEELLESVSLTPPKQYLERYPHELSGGQLQRINIARGLAVNPEVLLADEPISMLDVSVRLGVLNLLRELSDSRLLATMYITHDIASARYIADETAVMYAGQVVERARGTAVMDNPVHPYTQLLIASVPNPSDLSAQGRLSQSSSSSTTFNYEGCRFSPRCPVALDICRGNLPPEVQVAEGHVVRCWLPASDEQRSAVTISSKTK